jgi:hypothetical protein
MEPSPSPFSAAPPQHSCLNHPEVPTERRCGQCGQPFCEDCLVDIQGRPICSTCKALVLRDMQRRGGTRNKLAHDAFMYSLVGMVICGVVLEPMALLKGIQALQQFKQDPSLPDRWKAVTAVVISGLMISIYVVYFGIIAVAAITSGQ